MISKIKKRIKARLEAIIESRIEQFVSERPNLVEAIRNHPLRIEDIQQMPIAEMVTPSSYPEAKPTLPLVSKIHLLEQQTRFLLYDNIRVNQLLRELIYLNNLKRGYTGIQTKESFDYQWREIPEGEWMPSNPEFLSRAAEHLLEFTQIPREWFREKKILDAGCGSGRWTYAMSSLGAQVTSFDQSEGALNAVRKLTADFGSVSTVQGDLINLPFPDQSFDMVWCFGVPHHTENPLQVLKHLTRCVVPGGYIFVMLYAFPESIDAFSEQANYEEWRQKLMPKSNHEKISILKDCFPPQQVHGYFDALSPTINDLFTYEWMEAFLVGECFDNFHRVPTLPNHYVTARKRP